MLIGNVSVNNSRWFILWFLLWLWVPEDHLLEFDDRLIKFMGGAVNSMMLYNLPFVLATKTLQCDEILRHVHTLHVKRVNITLKINVSKHASNDTSNRTILRTRLNHNLAPLLHSSSASHGQ